MMNSLSYTTSETTAIIHIATNHQTTQPTIATIYPPSRALIYSRRNLFTFLIVAVISCLF